MEFSASSAKFVYHPALRAERFSPTAGPLSGGTPVVIDGSGFPATSRLACRFGRIEVKATLGSPPTRMICVAPKLAWERRVPVQVTANGIDWENVGVKGTAEVDTSFFTYYKPPKLRQLHPSIGSLFGGTRVSIFIDAHPAILGGDGLLLCRFGNVSVPSIQTSETIMAAHPKEKSDKEEDAIVLCDAPDLGAGNLTGVEVSVSVDGGLHFSSPALVYTYLQVSATP